jgi:pimeloyl-ACP methyl ester carboxylesterase
MGERERSRRQRADKAEPELAPPIVHEVLAFPGRPLDDETRAFMEPRFGHDFSRVGLHTNARAAASAEAVNALAYTVGQDIVFGAGQYQPRTSEGRRLIAHELAHTVQQGLSIRPAVTAAQRMTEHELQPSKLQPQVSIEPVSEIHEREANRAANNIAQLNHPPHHRHGKEIVGTSRKHSLSSVAPQLQRQTASAERSSNDASTTTKPDPVGVTRDPLAEDQFLEYLAKHVAYVDELTPEMNRRLVKRGYKAQWQDKVDDRSTSFFAGLIMPDRLSENYVPGRLPVIVFRGSKQVYDWVVNADIQAVGASQFQTNRALIGLLIARGGGRVNLTGHSLGGSLAQQAAVAFSGRVQRVVTFQAPGIHSSAVRQFQQGSYQPQVAHHVSRGDVVDAAGEQHLPGEMYLHGEFTLNFVHAHTRMLLTKDNDSERVSDKTYAVHRAVEEPIRRKVGVSRPAVGLVLLKLLTRDDDTELAGWVRLTTEEELAQTPTAQRAAAVDRLRRGLTGDRDEQCILKLLRASAQARDLVSIVNTVDAYQLADALDGANFRRLRMLLRRSYFLYIDQEHAFRLLRRCVDGATTEWKEELIADLLTSCPREIGHNSLVRIGLHYENKPSVSAGLSTLKGQVDGEDWGRIVNMFGLPDG